LLRFVTPYRVGIFNIYLFIEDALKVYKTKKG